MDVHICVRIWYGSARFKPMSVDMTTITDTGPTAPPEERRPARRAAAWREGFASAERIAALAKALSEPLRVEIVDLLSGAEQEVCQCELIPRLGITQPLLSHHMGKLVDAGLVEVERRHRWAYYRINAAALAELAGWLTTPLPGGRR
jgi:ArsR family transcriptional regulator